MGLLAGNIIKTIIPGAGGISASAYWMTRKPSDAAITGVTPTIQDLAWTLGSKTDYDSLIVERASGGEYSEIATLGPTTSMYRASGLTANTLYTFRIRAKKSSQYSDYTNVVSGGAFILTDADSNVYTAVNINGQWWMKQNLKTTKYNDASEITNVSNNAAWAALTTEAYSWYDNDIANKTLFGALYNGYSVDSGKLAPSGWLVPCNGDLLRLIATAGGTDQGGKLKKVDVNTWSNPNVGADDSLGLSLVGAGFRNNTTGAFANKLVGGFILSTTLSTTNLYTINVANGNTTIGNTAFDKKFGFSVRLIRNTWLGDAGLFYGDSITAGTGASDAAHRWVNILTTAKNITLTNNGVGGAPLQNTAPTNPAGVTAVNFRDSVSSVPARVASQRKSICIAYGTNDVGFNFNGWTIAQFKADYREIMNVLATKGWTGINVILVSPFYSTQTGRDSYTFWGVTTPATEQRLIDHVQAVQDIATEYHVQFADVYTYMKDNGGAALLGADGLHPNDAGHAAIAAYIQTVIE